jgi:WD40 repeat protein
MLFDRQLWFGQLVVAVPLCVATYLLDARNLAAEDTPGSRSSPEATIALHLKAASAKDMPQIFAGLSPDSQQRLLSSLLKPAHQFALRSPEEDLAPLAALLKPYHVDLGKAADGSYEPELFAEVERKAACLTDLLTWHAVRKGNALASRAVLIRIGELARLKEAELGEVTYQGTTARGVLLMRPAASNPPTMAKTKAEDDGLRGRTRQRMAFVKVGDEWRIDLVATSVLRNEVLDGLVRERLPPAKKVAVKQATPDEAFETLRSAMVGRDWKTAFLLVDDDYRRKLLEKAGGLPVTDESRKIVERHGLTLVDLLTSSAEQLKGKADCFRELMEYRETREEAHLPGKLVREWSQITAVGTSELRGQQAWVKIKNTSSGQEQMGARAFIKIDGAWRLDDLQSAKASYEVRRDSVQRHRAWNTENTFNSSLSAFSGSVFEASPKLLVMAGHDRSGNGVMRVVEFPSLKTVVDVRNVDPPAMALAFSPDGAMLAVSDEGRDLKEGRVGRVRLFDIERAKFVGELGTHEGAVRVVRWASDGKTLYTGDSKGRLHAWNTSDGSRRWTSNRPNRDIQIMSSLALSPDGKVLASTASPDVDIWDTASGRRVALIDGHEEVVYQTQFSPDGALLATASEDETVKLWDAKTYQWRRTLDAHQGGAQAIAFSPDGKLLASAGSDWTVKVWEVATGRLLDVLTGHIEPFIDQLRFSADGKTLVSKSNKGVVLWDMAAVAK